MPSKAKKTNGRNATAKPQPLSSIPKPTSPDVSGHTTTPISNTAPVVNGQHVEATGDTTESAGELNSAPSVNRKKQKRREKEAAKRAAQDQLVNGNGDVQNGHSSIPSQGRGPMKGYFTEEPDYAPQDQPEFGDVGSPEDAFYSGDEDPDYDHPMGAPNSSWLNTSKRKKTKKRGSQPDSNVISRTSTAVSRSQFPAISNATLRSAHRMGDQLWNPSTQAERESIKQFWLGLGEDERRSLVKIEKEAVLRKMKEQQKHSCSCSVCGRKRTAIEEELEVLYDAYYEELEQFANHNPDIASAPQLMAPPKSSMRRGPGPIPGSFDSGGRVQELDDEDDEDFDEDEEYDEDEEPYSDEEDDDLDFHGLPPGPPDFFQFGNSLTVKDGILTVADDLLKNDGRHFIDMMEQLAERRMQREEEVHFPSSALAHQDGYSAHNHAPLDEEDDYDDEEDDEDYDSQEEDDLEGDEMDSMTEEQRMEEGRRMFQIFAARMFEQRVLTAYREKVAAERQTKLLQELEEENRLDTQREAKKAKEAAKKKEKKKAQKQAKDEEKARKDAEKAAEEAAVKEAEEQRLEEQRQRKEEQRKKREAERKAAEDDRQKKETEKLRRQQEQKDRQVEAERKQREAKERERLKKEESKKKEREEREAKDKDARDRKTKEAEERRSREEHARREKDAAPKGNSQQQDRVAQARPQPVALPPGLHPPARNAQIQSPQFQIATPVMPPKVPTPAGRNRQASQPNAQGQSHTSSPRSQKASTEHSSNSPASVAIPQTPSMAQPPKSHGQPPMLHHPQPSAPRSPLNNPNRNHYAFNMNGIPGLGLSGPPSHPPGMMPGMMPQMPMYQGPPMGGHSRYGPNAMQYPQNFAGPRSFQPGQPMPFHPQAPPNAAAQAPQAQVPKTAHSRQPSGSTSTETSSQPAPIARPGPIARPPSTTPDRQKPKVKSPEADIEQITTQLGSKALLDDDEDEPLMDSRAGLPPVGAPGTGRLPFASSFESKQDAFHSQGWGGFGAAPGWSAPGSQRSVGAWPSQPFGSMHSGLQPSHRAHLPRPIAVRLMLVDALRLLNGPSESSHSVQTVLAHLETLKAPGEPGVSMDEMLGICDTEGNAQNGGGSFEVFIDKARGQMIKFTEDFAQPRASVGDIGSPLPSHSQPAAFPIRQGFGPPGRGF